MPELLVGCGADHAKKLWIDGKSAWSELVTLDINPAHKPDIVWDLNERPLPFEDDAFDEIHAYEILEHLGRQGDYVGFFDEWSEWWRILKPGGLFFATCPSATSRWAWGDPSHTRIVSPESLTFLEQPQYDQQVGKTAMSDFRQIYRADFDLVGSDETPGETFRFVLRAVKPSRITK